jgi:hypothetical protein
MRALEELLAAVNDNRSRQHLAEATRAYNAGATAKLGQNCGTRGLAVVVR